MTLRKALLFSAPLLLLPVAAFSEDRAASSKADIWAEANVVLRNGPVSVKTLANMPRLIGSPVLPYPEVARQSNVSGAVCVELKIDKEGRVAKVNAVCGPPMLRVFAEHAIRNWRYQPAREDGRPVEMTGYVLLNFSLD